MLEFLRLGRRAELQVRRAVESGLDVLQSSLRFLSVNGTVAILRIFSVAKRYSMLGA